MKLFAKTRVSFPDPGIAMPEGVVDVSDDLRVERLLEAYSFGIFPWPHEDLPTIWFCPERRGVLDFADFHVSRSLRKVIERGEFECTFNRCFDLVVDACSQMPRAGQSGTWITERLIKAYKQFHTAGYAHSLEVWHGEDLVGGLYGVYVAGVFSGESMFFLRSNASKVAVVRLVEFLRSQGLKWMDIQMVTPVMGSFGGHYVSRMEYLCRLEYAKQAAKPLVFRI